MKNTEMADTPMLLGVAAQASSDLAKMMSERGITMKPDSFIQERAILISELRDKVQEKRHFLDQSFHISLDIAEPKPTEEPGQWHPRIRVEYKGQSGEAILNFDLPESDLS